MLFSRPAPRAAPGPPPHRTARLRRGASAAGWLAALCLWLGLAWPAQALDRVVLQLQWDHQFQFAGYYAAQWQGYYREAGIEVEIRSAFGPDAPIRSPPAEIAAGRAQFGVSNAGVLLALSEGAPISILASIFQQSGTRGWYRPDIQITTPADLLKLRIGRVRGASLLDVELRALLVAEGLDPRSIKTVEVEPARLWDAFLAGEFDLLFGYSLTVPWEAKERGVGELRTVRPSDYGVAFYGDSLIADARLVADNPDLARRFRDASLRGWQYALEHRREIAERIARDLPRIRPLVDPLGYNLAQTEGVTELTLHPLVQVGHTNPGRWVRMRDHLVQAGVTPRPAPVEAALFDPEGERRRAQTQRQRWLTIGVSVAGFGLAGALIVTGLLRHTVARRTSELRQSEARLRAILDHSPESIFVVRVTPDGDYVYQMGNPATSLLSGASEAQMRGRSMRDFLPPEMVRMNFPHYDRCVATGEPVQFDYTRRHPHGSQERETILVPLKDLAGRVIQIVGNSRDVTGRKEREAILRQAQKMEAVGQLTGGLAHDFNNLLTVIVGGIEGIRRAPQDSERIARYAGLVLEAAQRGAKLTQQLLAFSRRQALQPKVIDVNALLTDFQPLMARAAGEAVELCVAPAFEPACVRLDPSQFESAILNLVVNARDAMPNGGSVTIEVQRVDLRAGNVAKADPGPYVVVSVTDTGEGMPADVLERVFEPFFTTKEVGKGTGLGLSQVYGFVRQSGGQVRLDSVVARGTRVRLYLPAETEARPEAERPAAAQAEGGHETILLVEDHAEVRAMAEGILAELGYRVVLARTAVEGLDILMAGEPVDLLFTDVVMPGGMSGLELAAEARRLRPDLAILATSGHLGEREEGARDVAAPILPKPYDRADLARAVRRAIDERRAPSKPAAAAE
ncbi:ABC transporter substrate-binding protein [Salinarimonas soli]|uniref:histidine kinase n=1 Tax=Salinarimonas soli TaxID=1638099 RepID=A0A5B2V9G8_9HYPH|nr:ABC transporter substrate-binding protein [Salinarimonas soli]KAA2235032.1 PAS domain-containing protein [Salinarimonas soli]